MLETIVPSRDASSFRIPGGDKVMFVFKVFKDEDAGKAVLFHCDVKGSGREYLVGKWKRRDFTPERGVQVNVGKFGTSSYKLTPEAAFEPGEYALTMGPTVFTFGVDAKK